VCLVSSNAGATHPHLAPQDLAKRGAKVIMVCRNEERGKAAVQQVQESSGNADIHLKVCDVSSTSAITRFVEDYNASGLPLHVLVNNAGVMASRDLLDSR
jgi:short-subunit dehydrogenase